MRKGLAFVISAPSGAGKSTLAKMLMEEFSNICFSVSCTTRSIRQGEVHGKDYCFMGTEEFIKLRNAGEFAEWAVVHDNYYGTPRKPVLEMLESGKDVLFDIDVQGAAKLRLVFPMASFVFILPPSLKILAERLSSRSLDSRDIIAGRLLKAKDEIMQAMWYDSIIVNDNLEEAYARLRAVYITATLAPHCNIALLDELLDVNNG